MHLFLKLKGHVEHWYGFSLFEDGDLSVLPEAGPSPRGSSTVSQYFRDSGDFADEGGKREWLFLEL